MTELGPLKGLLAEVEELQRQLEVLRARLTDALPGESLPSGTLSVLLCRVGDQRVALSLEEIQEVVLIAEVSVLPDAPDWIPGLLNLRGLCFPVLDVGARFQGSPRQPQLSDLIVVCELGRRQLGLIVEEVFDVSRFPASSLGTISPEASLAPFLKGVLRDGDSPVLLLSIPRLLALTELQEHQE